MKLFQKLMNVLNKDEKRLKHAIIDSNSEIGKALERQRQKGKYVGKFLMKDNTIKKYHYLYTEPKRTGEGHWIHIYIIKEEEDEEEGCGGHEEEGCGGHRRNHHERNGQTIQEVWIV